MLTFSTDFGEKAPYVAEMKGSVYKINPNIEMVDITHKIDRHSIFEASFVMEKVKEWFPPSVHVCVVDPGVGSERDAVVIRSGDDYFVGPNNGIFSLIDIDKAYKISENEVQNILDRNISRTFHGRDVFAPVGAFLELGYEIDSFCSPIQDLDDIIDINTEFKEENNVVSGKVLFIDDFGNIITNIRSHKDSSKVILYEDKERELDFVDTYSDASKEELIAVKGSQDYLEISANRGNASEILNIKSGEDIKLEFR